VRPGHLGLARHVQRAGVELVAAPAQQLAALHCSAGRHPSRHALRDEARIQPAGHPRLFARNSVRVGFPWRLGRRHRGGAGQSEAILSWPISGAPDVTIVPRRPAAASCWMRTARWASGGRCARSGIPPASPGTAWRVHSGAADACLATRRRARVFGLGFVGLVSQRYDLAIRARIWTVRPSRPLLTPDRAGFRRELEAWRYDTTPPASVCCGRAWLTKETATHIFSNAILKHPDHC